MDNTQIRFSRNSTVEISREVALIHLDERIHAVGQPAMALYWTDETKTEVNTVLAVGVKNGIGKDCYRVISAGQFILVWGVSDREPDVSQMINGESFIWHDQFSNKWFLVTAPGGVAKYSRIGSETATYLDVSDNTFWVTNGDGQVRHVNDIFSGADAAEIKNLSLQAIEIATSVSQSKVDKISGKGLSTNDFTNDLKGKLEGIELGAQKNVQSDWKVINPESDAHIKNKPQGLSDFEEDITYDIESITSAVDGSIVYRLVKIVSGQPEYVGREIRFPKLQLIESATIETCVTPDIPVEGLEVGDKYFHFRVRVGGTDEDPLYSDLYLPAGELIPLNYIAGPGINITGEDTKQISINLDDSGYTNGLRVDSNYGLSLSLAKSNAAGAMSSQDKVKLDNTPNTVFLTAQEYEALEEKDPNTLYYITEEAYAGGGGAPSGSTIITVTGRKMSFRIV